MVRAVFRMAQNHRGPFQCFVDSGERPDPGGVMLFRSIGEGCPFPHHQRAAGSIGDVTQANLTVQEERAVSVARHQGVVLFKLMVTLVDFRRSEQPHIVRGGHHDSINGRRIRLGITRALEDRQLLPDERQIVGMIHGEIELDLIVQRRLIQVWQHEGSPPETAGSRGAGSVAGDSNPAWGECVEGIMVIVQCQANLLQVVFALRTPGGFPGLLHRR